jgi:hypothetical protein
LIVVAVAVGLGEAGGLYVELGELDGFGSAGLV